MVKQKPLYPLLSSAASKTATQETEELPNGESEQNNIEIDPKAEIREQRKARKRKKKESLTDKEKAAIKKAEIAQKRRSNRIHVQGSDVPVPAET